MISNIIRAIILTTIFTLWGIFFRSSFVSENEIEEAKRYLWIHHHQHLHSSHEKDSNYTHSISEIPSAPQFTFFYYPKKLQEIHSFFVQQVTTILTSQPFITRLAPLHIKLYDTPNDVRGKMKESAIHMYRVSELENSEAVWVFIHELAHHMDIYTLTKKVFRDPSEDFYDISWESTTNIRSGERIKDFVSGYAMTNKYEDFAESLTYYIFANEEMRQKANKSFSIKQKYEFFEKNIFTSQDFKNTNFSNQERKRYYWDITKKWFDIEKFLEYLEKQV